MTILHTELRRNLATANTFVWIGVSLGVIGFFILAASAGPAVFWFGTVFFGNGDGVGLAVSEVASAAASSAIFGGLGGALFAIGLLLRHFVAVETLREPDLTRHNNSVAAVHFGLAALLLFTGVSGVSSSETDFGWALMPVGVSQIVAGLVFIGTGLTAWLSGRS